ncbi:hypothetical protein BQ8420_28520 [Nocardiopsis sp. JB363]|nr:hypothetical protein BQ8420_28520 [Nocardiopsis sp. JB363]
MVAAALALPTSAAVADTAPAPGDTCTVKDSRTPVTLDDGTVLECQKDPDNPRNRYWVIISEPDTPATPEEGADCEEGADPSTLDDGTVLECVEGTWTAVQEEDPDNGDGDDTGNEDDSEDEGESEGEGEGGDTDSPAETTVTFTDTCDGVSGELILSDDKGKFRYSTWLDDEQVADGERVQSGQVLAWESEQLDQMRMVVEHKPKGKGGEWETVVDVTHTWEQLQDCEDEGEKGGTDEDDKSTPAPGDNGKGEDGPAQQAGAGGTLPVTGGALAGLVAAAVAAVGAGGGALYLARKRKAAAGEGDGA